MELENGRELRTGAVIVAAGHKSKNTPFNPLLPVGDSTVIRRIIITLKRAGVSPIVVITGDKAEEIEKHISNLQVICLRNEQYAVTQMFSSICMGLNYIEDLCDRVFLLPAKFPVFLRETVQQMMDVKADIVRPVFDDYRGHPVLITSRVLKVIASYQGDRGLRGALYQASQVFREEDIPVEDQGIIRAIETEGDSSADFIFTAYFPYGFHADCLQTDAYVLYKGMEDLKGGRKTIGIPTFIFPFRRQRRRLFQADS